MTDTDKPEPIQAQEITDPEERLRVWAESLAGDLELEPLPTWMQPARSRNDPHGR